MDESHGGDVSESVRTSAVSCLRSDTLQTFLSETETHSEIETGVETYTDRDREGRHTALVRDKFTSMQQLPTYLSELKVGTSMLYIHFVVYV